MSGHFRAAALACTAPFVLACGGASSSPMSPTATIASVTVGVSGNASTTLAPGETRQLFATANTRAGSTIDVTNLATWQSSNPTLATVSPAGVLTAAAEGSVDISATYSSIKGMLHAEIKKVSCDISVTPAAASFGAFGGSATLTVATSPVSCRWTARSDAAWFPFTYDPGSAGGGSFSYTLPANSTPSARNANIIVESTTGQQAQHAISEGKPAGCSYVTEPDEATFTAAGGTGQFNVITTPGDCQWTLKNGLSSLGVSITSGFAGTGAGTVRYLVLAHTRSIDADGYIEVAGLSGLNPNGRHHVVLLKR